MHVTAAKPLAAATATTGGPIANRQRHERAFWRGRQRTDRVAGNCQLLGSASKAAPVDSHFRRALSGARAPGLSLRGQALRLVVDIAIAWIAIAIAQRQHPQLRRCRDTTLCGNAVAEPFG